MQLSSQIDYDSYLRSIIWFQYENNKTNSYAEMTQINFALHAIYYLKGAEKHNYEV